MSQQKCNERARQQECEVLCDELDKFTLKCNSNTSFNSFTTLPLEILYKIFESCPLRDQLIVAKVCRLFLQIIRDMNERKFIYFNYNYLTFKYTMELQNYEISELCSLCGKAVERLRFSTFLNTDLLKQIEWSGIRTNPMENLKFFINDNFKQNVKYFKNLKVLEVQGKFLQDQTILELAKHCKKLKILRLMDGDNRWLLGAHLRDLEAIENLELKFCRNLEPNHLLAVSQRRQLKSLNIVECDHLKDIPTIIKLCDHWQSLETLRLTAFSEDSKLIKALVNLPSLKTLQFYWINLMSLDFEETFFAELSSNPVKCLQLKHIKFENDRYYIEDESVMQLTAEKYAIMRENVCVNGQSWQWSPDLFNKISKSFENFKNLLTLSFCYCRLLDYEQLQHIGLISHNLELIKIFGCPKKEDEQFQKQWQQLERSCKCQLNFESLLPLKTVADLYEKVKSRREFSRSIRGEPVLRSIECQFS